MVQKACFISNEQFYLKEVQLLTRFITTLGKLKQIEVCRVFVVVTTVCFQTVVHCLVAQECLLDV